MERNRNFPQNYVESSHRREWFQEKFGDEDKDDAQEVTETPIETMEMAEEVTRVEPMTDDNDDSEDEVMSVVVDQDENTVEEICDNNNDEDDSSHEQVDIKVSDESKEDIIEPKPDEESNVRDETDETEDADEVQGAVGGQIDDATETTRLSSDPKAVGAKMNFDHLSEKVSFFGGILIEFNKLFLDWWHIFTKQSSKICQSRSCLLI